MKKNLDNLNSQKNYSIYEKNIVNELNLKELKKKFDIIFLDPPYKEKDLEKILFNIIDQKILKQDGTLIMHRHKKQNDIMPKTIKILEEKKYGISKIYFISF